MASGGNGGKCSVINNSATEVQLDKVGEMLEDGDEQFWIQECGACQGQGSELSTSLLEECYGVVDGSWLDLKMTYLGLNKNMKVVSEASSPANDGVHVLQQ